MATSRSLEEEEERERWRVAQSDASAPPCGSLLNEREDYYLWHKSDKNSVVFRYLDFLGDPKEQIFILFDSIDY